jgi:hypothetical protein
VVETIVQTLFLRLADALEGGFMIRHNNLNQYFFSFVQNL